MKSICVYQTSMGKVEVEFTFGAGQVFQSRKITLQNAALSLSGVHISGLIFDLEVQGNLSLTTVSSFEKYLLSEPHSFTWHDMKELAEKFDLSKYFPAKLFRITFFPDDSLDMWFVIESSVEKKHTFTLVLWNGDIDDLEPGYTCEVGVGKDGDILVRALEIICSLACAIRSNGLDNFLTKLKLFSI